MAERTLSDIGDDPFARAAFRTRSSVRPRSLTRQSRGEDEAGTLNQALVDLVVPQTPLDVALMALGPAGKVGKLAQLGTLLTGGMLEQAQEPAESGVGGKAAKKTKNVIQRTLGKLGEGEGVDRYTGAAPKAKPGTTEAPFPQYAEEYPAIGPPELVKDKKTGKEFLSKQLTPEAERFMKARTKIAEQMEAEGYEPYFDPAKRSYVDPKNYPPAGTRTLTEARPSKEATIEQYRKVIDTPETRKRLEAAYRRGLELGDTGDWYAMAQLEKAYTKELGMKDGRRAFLEEFAAPMAATTSGNDPRANFLMAHFLERQRKLGRPTDLPGYEMPASVGGRRPAMNVRDYNAMRERGGAAGMGVDQPKMHNFMRNFVGDLEGAVMDEQMATGMLAGKPQDIIDKARKGAFGMLEQPVHDLAAKRGVKPANVQDVAWFGFKNQAGQPMISVVNDSIERTHRLTGMPRDEIVRRGIVRKEIPLYATGGGLTLGEILGGAKDE